MASQRESLLSGGGASGAFARRKTTCDLGWVGLTVARIARTLIGCAHEARIAAEFPKCRDCEILAARAAIQVPQRHQDHRRRSSASHPPTPSFISYHSLKGLSTSQVHTSPFEILRRVSKIQRHFSGKSKSSLLVFLTRAESHTSFAIYICTCTVLSS